MAMCFLGFLNIAEDHFSGGRPLIRQGGVDVFVFEAGFGNDRILDFTAAAEAIDLLGLNAVGEFDYLVVT